jgi:glyoxylase-like metal-dependent hydrolase (beta-lactamase superfamily II)
MIVVPGLHVAERTAGGRCYLVEHPLGCVLIDTGAPDGTLGASHLLESAGRRPEEVRLILLTHGHRGHAGNAAGLRVLTGAPVGATAAAAEALAHPPPASGGLRRLLGGGVLEPLSVDRALEPGEVIDLAGGIAVVDAPGHALGSVAFHLLLPDALCVGDAASVDRRGALAPPPARRCRDADAARATAAALAAVGARILAPGHGVASIGGRLPVRGRR